MSRPPVWPIHPHPCEDELLSSWMVRIAEANGFKILSFYPQFFGRFREIWTRDIDHNAPAWLLEGLAARTGLPLSQVEALSLRSFEGLAFEQLNPHGPTRGLLPLGVYHRTRHAFGQQFCPLCLASDATPYLRKRWRLAVTTSCARHRVGLLDRCGNCAAAMAFHRRDIGFAGVRPKRRAGFNCLECDAELTTEVKEVDEESVRIQLTLERILDAGYVRIGSHVVYSHLFLDGFLTLIVGSARLADAGRTTTRYEFEAVDVRRHRLRAAFALLPNWPETFLEFCRRTRRPYSVFTKDQDRLPYWIGHILRSELLVLNAPISDGEAEAIRNHVERLHPIASAATIAKVAGRDLSRREVRITAIDDGTVERLLCGLDHRIAECNGDERLVLLRDKVMLIVGRILRLGLLDLAQLQLDGFARDAGAAPHWDGIETRQDALALIGWYIRHVRESWVVPVRTTALFVSATGNRLSTQAIGARFGLAVQAAYVTAQATSWLRWANPTRKPGIS